MLTISANHEGFTDKLLYRSTASTEQIATAPSSCQMRMSVVMCTLKDCVERKVFINISLSALLKMDNNNFKPTCRIGASHESHLHT